MTLPGFLAGDGDLHLEEGLSAQEQHPWEA